MKERIIIEIEDENWDDDAVHKYDDIVGSLNEIMSEYFNDVKYDIKTTL